MSDRGGIVHGLADRAVRVHVEQQAEQRLRLDVIEVAAEQRQRQLLVVRIDELLVGVDGQRPVPVAEGVEHGVHPVHAPMAAGVAVGGGEDVYVRFAGEQLKRAVGRAVVDDEEAIDAERAMMTKRRRQAQRLVAHNQERPDFTGRIG